MKENWNTRVVGQRVVLVPYRKHHVEKYHAWMQDPELQVGVWFYWMQHVEKYHAWMQDPELQVGVWF
jgi:hypothetical protein